MIPCDDSVDCGVAQVCNRVTQDSCKAHLGKLIINNFQNVLCLRFLIANGVGINSNFIHHRDRILDVGRPHPLDDCIVRFNNALIDSCVHTDNRRLNETLQQAREAGLITQATLHNLTDMLQRAYEGQAQHPKRSQDIGYVRITLLPKQLPVDEEKSPIITLVEELQERGFAPEEIAILGGLSKSFAMTGWRVGYLVAHPDLIKKISSMQGHSTSNICSIAQKAAVAALNGPLDCLTPMLEAFQRRRDMAMQAIRSWPWAVCPQPDGAFYLFVDVSGCYGGSVKNSTELCTRLLDEAHVALVPGAAFGDDNCIRFSYAVADDVLAKALEASGKVMAKLAADK